MRTLRAIREVRAALWTVRTRPCRVGLVPTMGALHDGHAALMRAARGECDVVLVSLFVNPTQFGPGEDFDHYPRSEADDAERANELGVDFLFAPSNEEVYPPGFATTIDPGPIASGMCGRFRPGHFAGVATVLTRLFGIVAPDVAYFGLKDYQQVAVVRRVVTDLALPVEIRAIATVREPDGLALSSRNRYLGGEERLRAAGVFAALQAVAAAHGGGQRETEQLVSTARAVLDASGLLVDYAELRDAETLGAYTPERAAVFAIAVRTTSGVRLIDNTVLPATPAPAVAQTIETAEGAW